MTTGSSAATMTMENQRTGQRIADHVREAKGRTLSKLNVLVITHQVVIEEVARQFGVRIGGDLDFLDYVVMIR